LRSERLMNDIISHVDSVDLSTLPLGSRLEVCSRTDDNIYRDWIVHTIDIETSQQLIRSVKETAKAAKVKLRKDETEYIGISMQSERDSALWRPIMRPIATKLLEIGQPWQLIFTRPQFFAVRDVTIEDTIVTSLIVSRRDSPQPTLDLADLPVGACVEVRTTNARMWLAVTDGKGLLRDMVFGILCSSTDSGSYTGPPQALHRYINVGSRIDTVREPSGVVLSYTIL
jgi:hypothetical protein